MINDVAVVVKAKVGILASLIVFDANPSTTVDLILNSHVLRGPQDKVSTARLDKDWQDEGPLRISDLFDIDLENLAVAEEFGTE